MAVLLTNLQPFSWKAGILFVSTCGALVWYFEYEKERMQKRRIAEASKGMGRPKVGGSFDLVDQNGKPFSSEDMKGKYSLVGHLHPFIPARVQLLAGCRPVYSVD